jgi:hypothetical protein
VNVAQASLLNLNSTGSPDITTWLWSTNYDPNYDINTGRFTATSACASLDNIHTVNGTLSIDILIDPATGNFLSGSYNITGSIDDLGIYGPNLLSADIAQFGFLGEYDPMEFVFNVSSGDLKTLGYYPTQVGMILSDSGCGSDFTQEFDNFPATSDTFNVPEPSSWVLLSTLIISGWMAYRRQRVSR